MKPERIVTVGKVARDTLRATVAQTGIEAGLIDWRSASPNYIGRIKGMFSKEDLLKRFPEVAEVVEKRSEWHRNGYESNKVFFACHAVSKTKEKTN